MNGTDLKKISAVLTFALLVFSVLQTGYTASQRIEHSGLCDANAFHQLSSTANFEYIAYALLQSPLEIYTESGTERSEFKKTVQLIEHPLFQSSHSYSSGCELLLKKDGASPIPLYISYCNLLI